LRRQIDDAERAYWDAYPVIYDFRSNEEREKAAAEDMTAVFNART